MGQIAGCQDVTMMEFRLVVGVREGMALAERYWLDKRSLTRHSEWGAAILGGE